MSDPKEKTGSEKALAKAEAKAGKKVEKRAKGTYVCAGKSICVKRKILAEGDLVDVRLFNKDGLERLYVLKCIEDQS